MNFYWLWLRKLLLSPQALFQFSSFFSLFGLILAVASLTVALLAINSFSAGLQNLLINRQGHILIQLESPTSREEILEDISFYKDHIDKKLFFSSFEAILVKANSFKGVLVEAIEGDKMKDLSFLQNSLLEGSFQNAEKSVFIGKELANLLNLSVGSQVTMVLSKDSLLSRTRTSLRVGAIMDFGKHDLNSSFVLLTLSSGLAFNKLSGVKLWLKDSFKDIEQTQSLSEKMLQALPSSYSVQTWMQADPTFFEIIRSDKKIILFVLFILVIAAGFNVSSSLFIQVFKRTKEINLLRALGVMPSHLSKLFLLNGLILGFIGSLFGILLGLVICWFLIFIQNKWSFLPEESYQIKRMVWEWSVSDLALIFVLSLIVIVLSSVVPARKASQRNIKTALSYD